MRFLLFSATLLLMLGVSTVQADRDVVDEVVLAADVVNAVFNRDQRQVLDEYLEHETSRHHHEDDSDDRSDDQSKKKKLPPGLKKKLERGGQLPPGWQKKVERGEVLDVDVYHQAHPIPNRYLERLGHQPEGTSVLQIDDRIVRVHDATRTIIDVFLPGQ